MAWLRHLAPTCIVTAAFACCCWGYLADDTGLLWQTPGKLPRLEAKALRPDLAAPSTRDPFVPRRQTGLADLLIDKSAPTVAAAPQIDPREVLAELRLEGTSLADGARMALINQQLFREGDPVPHPLMRQIECRVTHIEQHGVLLSVGNEVFRLAYPALTTHSSASPASGDANGRTDVPAESNAPSTTTVSDVELPEGLPGIQELLSFGASLMDQDAPVLQRERTTAEQATEEAGP